MIVKHLYPNARSRSLCTAESHPSFSDSASGREINNRAAVMLELVTKRCYEHPSLIVAIARLSSNTLDNYAMWVLKAPYPGGYVLQHCDWTIDMTQSWLSWQGMFSLSAKPYCVPAHQGMTIPQLDKDAIAPLGSGIVRELYQQFDATFGAKNVAMGICWTSRQCLRQSQGISIGQNKPLRLR